MATTPPVAPASVTSEEPPVSAPAPAQTVLVITNRSDIQETVPILSWVEPSDSSKGFYTDSICSTPGSHCTLKAGWFPDPAFMETRSMLGTYVRTA